MGIVLARPKSTGEIKSHQQHLLMTPSEVEAIDDWRFRNRIGSRGEAIRRLCQLGIGLEENSAETLSLAAKFTAGWWALLGAEDPPEDIRHEFSVDWEALEKFRKLPVDEILDELNGLWFQIENDLDAILLSARSLKDGVTPVAEGMSKAREHAGNRRASRKFATLYNELGRPDVESDADS